MRAVKCNRADDIVINGCLESVHALGTQYVDGWHVTVACADIAIRDQFDDACWFLCKCGSAADTSAWKMELSLRISSTAIEEPRCTTNFAILDIRLSMRYVAVVNFLFFLKKK